MWVRKLDSNGLTKTKNWSGRNEVTETSGRLHPLWPQNKWIHTPRTTDYRHTRQDKWIQTELAFTLAKNATEPNPFEIIPQTTDHKEGEQLEDRRSVGASSCNSGDGTDQRVQSLMFMMMMMMMMMMMNFKRHSQWAIPAHTGHVHTIFCKETVSQRNNK